MIDPRRILRESGLSPKKSFGQNFLVSERIVEAIADACVPPSEKDRARVLELGAGVGTLTSSLATRARRLVAVERDRDLVPVLAKIFETEIARGTVTILEADAQAVDTTEILGPIDPDSPRVLCGNLPYQITGRLLERAIAHAASLERVVFMVQDEVAARLLASPGTKIYGALTVFVRAAFDVTKVLVAPPNAFHPAPDVTSAVVRLTPIRPARALETDRFRALVKGAFAMRRKTLRNTWSHVAPSEAIASAAASVGISLDARGETLDVEAFAAMERALDAIVPS